MKFVVKTRDVDGSGRREYKTRAAAWKRFEEMLGYSVEAAIDEVYYDVPGDKRPTRDSAVKLSYVSPYGTRVTFEAVE